MGTASVDGICTRCGRILPVVSANSCADFIRQKCVYNKLPEGEECQVVKLLLDVDDD